MSLLLGVGLCVLALMALLGLLLLADIRADLRRALAVLEDRDDDDGLALPRGSLWAPQSGWRRERN